MEETMLVLDSYEANYAVTISDVNTKRVIGVLYYIFNCYKNFYITVNNTVFMFLVRKEPFVITTYAYF